MRRFFAIFIILSFASIASARTEVVVGGGVPPVVDSTGVVYDAQVRFDATTEDNNFKVLIWSSNGTLIATSAAGVAASGVVTVTFSSGPTLNGNYFIGIVPSAGTTIVSAASAGQTMYNTGASYASPGNIVPGTDGWVASKTLAIAIRNSSGTVLLGDASPTATNRQLNTGQMFYREDVYAYP